MFEKNKSKATDEGAEQTPPNEGEKTSTATNGKANAKPAIKSKTEVATANDDDQFAQMFSHAKSSKGVEITAEYLDLSQLTPGENYIFAFLGMTTFTGDNGVQPAVRLVDEEKTQYIVASKVIVGALEKIADQVPAMVGITVNGKKKSGAGHYYDCTVVRY